MLIINGKKYATTTDEQTNSLFLDGGTLDYIESKTRKNETLFFTNKEKTAGFWYCPKTGLMGQFHKREKGYFFQFCLDSVSFWENGKLIAKA